jgi:hypothetical protein
MAAVALVSVKEGQSIVRCLNFSSVSDTNTYAYAGPAPKAFWTSVTSSSTAAVNASFSSGTFTFKVSSGSPDVSLFILL